MDHVIGLECTMCGETYSVEEVDYVCPEHGNAGILDVSYAYDLIRERISSEGPRDTRDASIWRYLPLLPLDPGMARDVTGDESRIASGRHTSVASPARGDGPWPDAPVDQGR